MARITFKNVKVDETEAVIKLQKRVESQRLTINYLESAVQEAEDRVKRLKADRLYFSKVIISLEDELAAQETKPEQPKF